MASPAGETLTADSVVGDASSRPGINSRGTVITPPPANVNSTAFPAGIVTCTSHGGWILCLEASGLARPSKAFTIFRGHPNACHAVSSRPLEHLRVLRNDALGTLYIAV